MAFGSQIGLPRAPKKRLGFSKILYIKWLRRSGFHTVAVRYREGLIADGMTRDEAWKRTFERWKPTQTELDADILTKRLPETAPRGSLPVVPRFQVGNGGIQTSIETIDSLVSSRQTANNMTGKDEWVGRVCGERAALKWVAANMLIGDVVPADAPSSTAWGLLVWARETPGNRRDFYMMMFGRTLPAVKDAEREDKSDDEGGDVTALLDRIGDSAGVTEDG